MSRIFAPESWLLSSLRALEDYLNDNLQADLYDVQMSFPDTTLMSKTLPFSKTIIHFDIENVTNTLLGIGDNAVDYALDEAFEEITLSEASWRDLELDVGIWASADSGGVTSRMVALQDVSDLLHGPDAQERCFLATEGVQIVSFEGGMFFVDSINDLPVWRVRNMTLALKVASKKTYDPLPLITEFDQTPGIYVEDEVIVPFGN